MRMKYQIIRSAPGMVIPAPPTGRLSAVDATKLPFQSSRRELATAIPDVSNCTSRQSPVCLSIMATGMINSRPSGYQTPWIGHPGSSARTVPLPSVPA